MESGGPQFAALAAGKAITRPRELIDAVRQGFRNIAVAGRIAGLPPLRLSPGQSIEGIGDGTSLVFNGSGLTLCGNNAISGMSLVAPSTENAISVGGEIANESVFRLKDLVCHGRIHFAIDGGEGLGLEIDRVGIAGADGRLVDGRPQCPRGDITLAALTIWNNSATRSELRVRIDGINIGLSNHPVMGSGMLISGGGKTGNGAVLVEQLGIGSIHADSGVDRPNEDVITGVLIINEDVVIMQLVGQGPIVTVGAQAHCLTNFGTVISGQFTGSLKSHGLRASALVNAGDFGDLTTERSFETHGCGAIACEIAGPMRRIKARAIKTWGAGAIAVSLNSFLGALELADGIFTDDGETAGGMRLLRFAPPAHAIHIGPTGELGRLVARRVRANGEFALPLRNEGRFGGRG